MKGTAGSASEEAVYLDLPASAPIEPRVVDAMMRCLAGGVGNPHAAHRHGREAAAIVEAAARCIADLIGADPDEIVFTSGATEANNAAIKGVMRAPGRRGNHVVVSAIEHSCVLEAVRFLRVEGIEMTLVPPDGGGVVRPDAISSAVRDDTALVSLMLLNNEIGTVQPVAEVSRIVQGRGAVMHTDAAQAVGKIPVDVMDLGADLLTLSGHKFHGPPGIGALYVSSACPVELVPLSHGGGQQRGRRGGTVPAFLCAGLGEAARLAGAELDQRRAAAEAAAEAFEAILRGSQDNVTLNGDPRCLTPFCRSYRFPGVDAAAILAMLDGRVSASTGSACQSGALQVSHVLRAIGLTSDEANASIRVGFGASSTPPDAERAARVVSEAVKRYLNASNQASPLLS